MTDRLDSFDRSEVTARGFEARCISDDRVEYLWHLGYGLRADPRDGSTVLITDPAVLPEGPGGPRSSASRNCATRRCSACSEPPAECEQLPRIALRGWRGTKVAGATGLEPATSGVTGRRSKPN